MPFQSKKGQKVSACGRHLYCGELRERLRAPFQSNKGQKVSACSRQLYYCEMREGQEPKRPKIFCLRQALKLLCTEREAEGALSKQKKAKKFLPAAGTYIIVF